MSLVPGSAFVTGGGSGIGRAIAVALAAAGAPVAVFDVRAEGAKETLQAIERRGGRAVALTGDASRWGDVDGAVAAAVGQLGPLAIIADTALLISTFVR